MNRLIGAGLVVCLFVVACGGSSRDEASDRAQLAAMEQEIVALVGEPVCGDSPDCRSIGFGAKPCGGPWDYMIYSVATVDNVVLTSKVAAYNEFNAELNIRYGWGSECSVALPPTLGCQAGVCVALNAR
jgi:hypothetical protein